VYNASMKQNAALNMMAAALDTEIVKLVGLHGVRWLASQTRAVRALVRNYTVVVAALESIALTKVGLLLLTSSPSEIF
jgi:hypothetical protein